MTEGRKKENFKLAEYYITECLCTEYTDKPKEQYIDPVKMQKVLLGNQNLNNINTDKIDKSFVMSLLNGKEKASEYTNIVYYTSKFGKYIAKHEEDLGSSVLSSNFVKNCIETDWFTHLQDYFTIVLSYGSPEEESSSLKYTELEGSKIGDFFLRLISRIEREGDSRIGHDDYKIYREKAYKSYQILGKIFSVCLIAMFTILGEYVS